MHQVIDKNTNRVIDYLLPELIEKEIILVGHGINWNWYCHVIFHNDGYATVLKEYRLHKYDDDNHPKATDTYQIQENTLEESRVNGRIAYGIWKGMAYSPFRNAIPRWDIGKKV